MKKQKRSEVKTLIEGLKRDHGLTNFDLQILERNGIELKICKTPFVICDDDADATDLLDIARKIGYPVVHLTDG
jgi:hypothetical protein